MFDAWMGWFPFSVAAPAFLIASVVAAYVGRSYWVLSCLLSTVFGLLFFAWYSSVSGITWFLAIVVVGIFALSLGTGYVVQRTAGRGMQF